MRDLNPIYEWIVEYKRTHDGNSPVYREIMHAFEIPTTSYMRWALVQLERRGLIRFRGRISRGVEIVGGRWVPPE